MLKSLPCGFLVASLVFLLSGIARGQYQEGDYVVATVKVDLRVQQRATQTVARGNGLKVEKVEGKWLWVSPEARGKPGWIESARVVATERAEEFFTEQIKKNPRDAEAYYARGQAVKLLELFERQGRSQEQALADFDQAIRLGYKTSDIYTRRAFVHTMLDNIDQGLKDLHEAIRLDPKNVEPYEMRESYWHEMGEFEKCLADLQTIVRLAPDEVDSYVPLAMFRAACSDAKYRDGKQAVAHATKACELSKWKDVRALNALAAAWAQSGDFDKAVEYGNQALAISLDYQQEEIKERLELYKAKKPYRREPPSKN